MSEPGKAVFLSYASQDAEAAKRICDALRAAGVEVWFDQNELVGGDAWDAKIRKQIADCALFVPIISANTQARREGYFRLEWKLAAQRTHMISEDTPFLLPVVIDDTRDAEARVPGEFKSVQWTRLEGGEASEKFCARVVKLLQFGADEPAAPREPAAALPSGRARRRLPWLGYGVAAVGLVIASVFALRPVWSPSRAAQGHTEPASPSGRVAANAKPLSEARRLADQAFALSIEKYDSTLDDYTTADALMKRAVALDANDGEILARSAQLQFMFRNRGFDYAPERISVGREQAERAVRLAPESTEAHLALSLAHRYTGNAAAMVAPLRRAIELEPDHARALLWLGSRLLEIGETEEGRALHDRARRNPVWAPLADYYDFIYNFGLLRFAEAERSVRRSYTAMPSINSAGGIALLHFTWTGDMEKAAQELSAVPPTMLNAPRIVWMTAQVHLHRRNPDEALRVLDRLPDVFIRDSWFTGPKALLAGRAHALAGRTQAARLAWESGLRFVEDRLKEDPAEPAIHRARGELLAALGRTEEALAAAATFEELTGGRVRSWGLSTATIYATLGRADLAVPKLASVLNEDAVGWPLTRTLLRQDPRWDPIRNDPAFAALLVEPAEAKRSGKASSNPPPPTADDKSVAVLPFANLSGDPAQEYFSDGLTEEILNALARERDLRVPGRASSFSFKGRQLSVAEIAKALNVTRLVEGSVRRSGNRVRISVSLTRASDGFSEELGTFTEELSDVFALQDKVASAVVTKLTQRAAAVVSPTRRTVKPEAYGLYLQAREAWRQRTMESFRQAEQLLQQALAQQPDYAAAMALLSMNYTQQATEGGGAEPETMAKAVAWADRALQADGRLADAHAAKALTLDVAGDQAGAIARLRHSVELDPHFASAHQWLGRQLSAEGNLDGSLASLHTAAQLDPLAPRILDNYASALAHAGRVDEALAVIERVLATQPDWGQAVQFRARFLVMQNRIDEALEFYLGRNLASRDPAWAARAFLAAGRRAEAEKLIEGRPRGFATGIVLCLLGRPEQALPLLRPASSLHREFLLWEHADILPRELPEFTASLKEWGLWEAWQRAEAWRAAHHPKRSGTTL